MIYQKTTRDIERVFLHCSASPHKHHDDVSVIEKWHKERFTESCQEFAGYHYFIKFDGTIQPSRPTDLKPVAQGGHNSHTIAVCLHGLNPEDFTEAQFESVRTLCAEIKECHAGVTFHGHCEVSTKACPVFDYMSVLSLDAFGNLNGDGTLTSVDNLPTLKVGSRGVTVRYLQQSLGLVEDGIFGEQTKNAVKLFQQTNSLGADGIVGRKTWETLINLFKE